MKKVKILPFVFLVLGVVVLGLAGQHVLQRTAHAEAEGSSADMTKEAWNVRCAEAVDGKNRCEMFQRLSVAETGKRVLELAVATPDSQTQGSKGVIVLPLGMLLPGGVVFQVDEFEKYTFSVNHCTEAGCIAYVDLNADILGQMKKGNAAMLSFYTSDKKAINIKLSLSGFSKALRKISR